MRTFHVSFPVLVLIPVFFFISCSKSEDPKLPAYLLTKVTTSTYTTEYTYDGEKAIGTSTTSGVTTTTGTFIYDANGNIVGITYSDNAHEVFTYTNGNITNRKKLDAAEKLLNQWDYEYSGGQLTKIQYYEVVSGVAYSASFRVYEYDNSSGDPARVKEYSKNSPTTPLSTAVYVYGQAKNAFDAAPAALKKYLRLLSASVEKNVVKITDGTKVWDYTYEFNDQDYPTKLIEVYSSGATYTTTYEYKQLLP